MPALPLSVLAAKSCLRNHKAIMDVGDAPYRLVREMLLKIEDPKQLREIEIASPQICGEDQEIWLNFIKRDVPGWDTKPHIPQNPQSWYKVYRKLVREAEREIERDAEILKATMDGIKKESDKHQLLQVNLAGFAGSRSSKNVPTINVKCDLRQKTWHPEEPKRTDETKLYGDPDLPGRRIGHRIPQGPRKPQGMQIKPPKGKLDKLKREARAAALFSHHPKPVGKSVWTAKEMKMGVAPVKTTLLTAPRSMIEDYKRTAEWNPHDPSIKTPTIFAPRKRRIEYDVAPQAKKAKTSEVEEREKRLKAFTNPSKSFSTITTTSRPSFSTPSTSPSQAFKKDTTLPMSKLPANPRTSSSPKSTARSSPAGTIGSTISRIGTSSPGNGGTPPPKRIVKSKAPVDIFMRPTKRPRVS